MTYRPVSEPEARVLAEDMIDDSPEAVLEYLVWAFQTVPSLNHQVKSLEHQTERFKQSIRDHRKHCGERPPLSIRFPQ